MRWIMSNDGNGAEGTVPEIDEFLHEIKEVYVKYDLVISHEDMHGAFNIVKYDEWTMEWLLGANDCRAI